MLFPIERPSNTVAQFHHSRRKQLCPIARAFSLKALSLALLLVLPRQNANATLFFADQFDYTNGVDLGSTNGGGGATWTLWRGDASQIKVSAASAQTAPRGFATAAGLGVAVTPIGSRKQTGVPFNGTTGVPVADGNVVYASFLLNVRALPASGDMRVAYMHGFAASQGGIEVVVSSTGQVGIQKKGSGTTFVSGTPVASPGTHLVIMRYTFQSGNDEVAVWVDPDRSSYGAAAAPATGEFAATTGGGSDMSSAITYFIIDSPALTGPVFWIDEVRVGTTWADVTPPGGVPRQLVLVTVLACGLVGAGFWIAQLNRKVKERSAALKAQIQERQRVEHQRLMDQERARIAHDLHDELGSDITEVSMLATRSLRDAGGGVEGRRSLGQMADKTRQMVAKLEEIVWAMNPQHDSMGALLDYFSFFADRFLSLANIKLMVDTSGVAGNLAVAARVRHQLFLVFKETLTNVVRHSGASEVRLVVRIENRILRMTLTDNGCGLRESSPTSGGQEGVAGMRRRMEKLGGQFEITGEAGHGTTVKFSVPLDL
jgi:signal transduction histidine kinase